MTSANSPTASAHVVPVHLLFGILGVLLALTFVTVAVTYFDFGAFNLWVALTIAVAKASLVALYFMHLRWDKPFNFIVFLVSILLVMLFVGMALLDTQQYEPNRIPGYAPKIEQRTP